MQKTALQVDSMQKTALPGVLQVIRLSLNRASDILFFFSFHPRVKKEKRTPEKEAKRLFRVTETRS